MIVLDANNLIRAVLGRRVRQLIDRYSAQSVHFFAPDVAFADAAEHLPDLLKKFNKPIGDLSPSLYYLRQVIESVDADLYGEFEAEARERMRSRDEDDWPVLATAIALGCVIWTEDADFFGAGIAIWTTDRIEILLRKQVKVKHEEFE